MSDQARQNILDRLHRQAAAMDAEPPPVFLPEHGWDSDELIRRFTDRMEAVRGEVIRVTESSWHERFKALLVERGVKQLLLSSNTAHGRAAGADLPPGVTSVDYDQSIEHWKQSLFMDVDASLTASRGGIAETGSLILWPTPEEPRLMSLVPPLHVCLLRLDDLYETFAQAMAKQDWAGRGMPTNALLISGPSKTADIEQVLAYGVHGPKQLVVLLVE